MISVLPLIFDPTTDVLKYFNFPDKACRFFYVLNIIQYN